jgi:hypothetical protein
MSLRLVEGMKAAREVDVITSYGICRGLSGSALGPAT